MTAKLPRSSTDMVQVVVNKAEEAWYCPGEESADRLPVIVARDQEALSLRPVTVMGCKRNKERENRDTDATKRVRELRF
jgi:hypothetical protein